MRRARNAGRAWDSHVWPTERALKEEIFDRYGIYTGYPMGIQVNEARNLVKPIRRRSGRALNRYFVKHFLPSVSSLKLRLAQ